MQLFIIQKNYIAFYAHVGTSPHKKQYIYEQKKQFRKNQETEINSPVISGTVVKSKFMGVKPLNKSLPKITNHMFERKLRMMRADLFSLLSCCQAEEFFKTPREAEIIKNAVIKYVETENV